MDINEECKRRECTAKPKWCSWSSINSLAMSNRMCDWSLSIAAGNSQLSKTHKQSKKLREFPLNKKEINMKIKTMSLSARLITDFCLKIAQMPAQPNADHRRMVLISFNTIQLAIVISSANCSDKSIQTSLRKMKRSDMKTKASFMSVHCSMARFQSFALHM